MGWPDASFCQKRRRRRPELRDATDLSRLCSLRRSRDRRGHHTAVSVRQRRDGTHPMARQTTSSAGQTSQLFTTGELGGKAAWVLKKGGRRTSPILAQNTRRTESATNASRVGRRAILGGQAAAGEGGPGTRVDELARSNNSNSAPTTAPTARRRFGRVLIRHSSHRA